MGCVFEVWPSPGALECFQTCGGKILSIFSEAFPDAVPNLSEFRPSFDRFLKGKASKSASYALRFRTMTRSDRHGTVYQDNPNSIDRRPAYDCLWPTGILHPMRITTQTMMSDLDLIYYTILYYIFEAPLKRRGSSCNAGCTQTQPGRPIIRPFRGAKQIRPECLQVPTLGKSQGG